MNIPVELKRITQYIRRAEELDKDNSPQSRIVAYYCRQYAVQVGISLAKTPAAKICLSELLGELEKEKVAMSNFSNKECYQVCRGFAFKIFDKADAEDRLGSVGKGTAKKFYAAATFLDLLKQFYDNGGGVEKSEETVEEEKKSFYSKWKATEILKAIKEGREPTPGGYGQDEKEEVEETIADESPQEPDITALKRPEEEEIPKAPVFVPPPPPAFEESSGLLKTPTDQPPQAIDSPVDHIPPVVERLVDHIPHQHETAVNEIPQGEKNSDESTQLEEIVMTEEHDGQVGDNLLLNSKDVDTGDIMEVSNVIQTPVVEDVTDDEESDDPADESPLPTDTTSGNRDKNANETVYWGAPPAYPSPFTDAIKPVSNPMERPPIVSLPVYKPPPPSSILPMPVPMPPPLPPVIHQPPSEPAPVIHQPPSDPVPVIHSSLQPGPIQEPKALAVSFAPPSFQSKTEPPKTEPPANHQFSSIFDKKSNATTKFTKDKISDATELTKIALKALEKKNGALAVERLRAALNCLEQG